MIVDNPFAEKVPSLFIVQTPFQAMCAISAIQQLKIDQYTLTLHLHKTTENRNKQTIEIVERYGLKYNVSREDLLSFRKRIGLLFKHTNRYKRVFLGTHLYQDGYYYSIRELQRGGALVHLDDGIATISLLKNQFNVTGRSIIINSYYKLIARLRNIKLNNVLTVYEGIENPKWNIAINDISSLRLPGMSKLKKRVFFIGTNNGGFISEGINEEDFKHALFEVLNRVRTTFPQEEIVYVPHGRDKSLFARDFCEKLGIGYLPLGVNVEVYILSLENAPLAIYGFTSSALYNLKRIFPETEVNNVMIKLLTNSYSSILEVSKYYETQGIVPLLFDVD